MEPEKLKGWHLDDRVVVAADGSNVLGLAPVRMAPEVLALVCAAPDLLAACEAMKAFYDRHGGKNNMGTPLNLYDALNSALAKAKGE
ncbi:MAG: hypothetical protein M5U26_23160 [Planctomycetota bacterium]|nr:hypothetical protein [Planctomycetota bacterium]